MIVYAITGFMIGAVLTALSFQAFGKHNVLSVKLFEANKKLNITNSYVKKLEEELKNLKSKNIKGGEEE